MNAIKRLELKAFRGASRPLTLDFDPSKPVIVLCRYWRPAVATMLHLQLS